MRGEGVGPIPVQAQTPSILTTAKPRTNDDFGVRVPLPDEVDVPEGALDPSKASWRTGISWVQTACAQSTIMESCPTGDDTEMGDMTEDAFGLVSSMPFWMFTPLECEWTTKPEDVEAASEALTEAHSAYALGRALWMGEGLGTDLEQPTLRNAAQIAPGGESAIPLDEAVAVLLAAYEHGTQGLGGQMLHIPGPLMVSGLGGLPGGGMIAKQEGSFYRAALGAVVSPGPGYPWGTSVEGPDGFGPIIDLDPATVYDGNDNDESWIYITGPVEYALSKIIPLPTTSSFVRQNRKLAWSMRQLIFRFDPCTVWAALVDSPVTFAAAS
jgi:hypothetical protein